jgi:hypothetical protein
MNDIQATTRAHRRAARALKLVERIAGQERDRLVLAKLVTGERLGLLPADCRDEARFESMVGASAGGRSDLMRSHRRSWRT